MLKRYHHVPREWSGHLRAHHGATPRIRGANAAHVGNSGNQHFKKSDFMFYEKILACIYIYYRLGKLACLRVNDDHNIDVS